MQTVILVAHCVSVVLGAFLVREPLVFDRLMMNGKCLMDTASRESPQALSMADSWCLFVPQVTCGESKTNPEKNRKSAGLIVRSGQIGRQFSLSECNKLLEASRI